MTDLLENDRVEASYMIAYNYNNPNLGFPLGNDTFSGPVVCSNEVGVNVVEANDNQRDIPVAVGGIHGDATLVNSLPVLIGTELQTELVDDTSKREVRVCQSMAGNTDCFFGCLETGDREAQLDYIQLSFCVSGVCGLDASLECANDAATGTCLQDYLDCFGPG